MAVLDLQVLYRITGEDDQAFILETLQDFHDVCQATLGEIHQARGQDDSAELARLCHRLKGTAGAMGARPLALACQAMEQAIRNDEEAGNPVDLLARLEHEISEVCTFCARKVAGDEQPA